MMESFRMPLATAPAPSHRPRWWAELPLIAVIYAVYSAGRLLVRSDVSTAVDHGLRILHLEKTLFLNAEHPLNRLMTAHPSIGIPADFAYASLHYLVTPAVLIWIYRRRAAVYRTARTWLMTSTLLGLIGFALLPTCPPRLLHATHGFVDTMAQYSSYGWWGTEASAPRGMGWMTNQYAAMPSLHVGLASRAAPAGTRRGRRVPTGHHDRRDGHGQPLLPRRGRGRRRHDRRSAADRAGRAARGPGAGRGTGPVRTGRSGHEVPDCQCRMQDFRG
jgi:hypothetical protein